MGSVKHNMLLAGLKNNESHHNKNNIYILYTQIGHISSKKMKILTKL